tara:strand:- start:1302 stop:2255 length:954 start_codon:yes stop_codon:yes gene_type:complete
MVGKFKQALLEKGDMSGMTQKGGHKRSTKSGAGLTQKGVEKYRRQNPGSKLKTAVTTPPSKLKPGSKAAKRRKSFCARSRGWTGERGKAARRRWNCSTDINSDALDRMSEMIVNKLLNEGKPKVVPKAMLRRVKNARLDLAERCWVGWTQKGLKKKGKKMVPNCVKEENDPRMKTTPASIQQAGGDPEAYKKEKAKKDPKPVSKKKNPSRRAAIGRSGGKFRRERIQPAKGAEGPSAPTRQIPVKKDVKGGKENFKKGTSEKPMSKKNVNKMGVRGQESKIAAKKRAMGKKTGAANIQLMKDMGVLKFDKQGRRIRK